MRDNVCSFKNKMKMVFKIQRSHMLSLSFSVTLSRSLNRANLRRVFAMRCSEGFRPMDIEMRALEGFRRGGGGFKTRHTPSSAAAAAASAAGEEAKSRSVQKTAPAPAAAAAAAATLSTQSLSEASNRRVGKEAPPPPFTDATATATTAAATTTDQLPRDPSGDRLVEQTLLRSVVALGIFFFLYYFRVVKLNRLD